MASARQVPSLPPGLDDRLRLPLRNPPGDPANWAQAWELAQVDERLRSLTEYWYALWITPLIAQDPRRGYDRLPTFILYPNPVAHPG